MGCDRFKVDATRWDGVSCRKRSWRIQRLRLWLQHTPGFRDAETENPRERGCWGIASPKRPALGAARTIIRQIRPTLYSPSSSYQRSLFLSSELPSSRARLPHGARIATRHWDLDPPGRASFESLIWAPRHHSYPHIPSLGNVVRLVPNKELPLPASSRHAELHFSSKVRRVSSRLGTSVPRALPSTLDRDALIETTVKVLPSSQHRDSLKRVEFLLFAR